MGLSIKKCAERSGICVQASFDQGQKVLSAYDQAVPEGFQGIVESDDVFFLESQGNYQENHLIGVKRPAKGSISDEQIVVVATCDKSDKQ